jgi:hypothetical protein
MCCAAIKANAGGADRDLMCFFIFLYIGFFLFLFHHAREKSQPQSARETSVRTGTCAPPPPQIKHGTSHLAGGQYRHTALRPSFFFLITTSEFFFKKHQDVVKPP